MLEQGKSLKVRPAIPIFTDLNNVTQARVCVTRGLSGNTPPPGLTDERQTAWTALDIVDFFRLQQ